MVLKSTEGLRLVDAGVTVFEDTERAATNSG